MCTFIEHKETHPSVMASKIIDTNNPKIDTPEFIHNQFDFWKSVVWQRLWWVRVLYVFSMSQGRVNMDKKIYINSTEFYDEILAILAFMPLDLEASEIHIFPQKIWSISFRGSTAECWSAAAESADWRCTCLWNKNVVLNIAQRIWQATLC